VADIKSLNEEIDLLLHSPRPNSGGSAVGAPHVQVVLKQGVIATLIDTALNSIRGCTVEEQPTVVPQLQLDSARATLSVVLSPVAETMSNQVIEAWKSDLRWSFIREETPVYAVRAENNSIVVYCGPLYDAACTAGTAAVLSYYYQAEHIYNRQESELSARLLHDLKNTLVGYSVALSETTKTPTEALTYRLLASRHRDSAVAQIASLRSLWSTLATLEIASDNPIRFIRRLVAETLNTMPTGIRLIPKLGGDDEVFATDYTILTSIVTNLLKNAVEALPAGGDIVVEAIVMQNLLVVDIVDSGPGMLPELVDRVMAGELISSTKRTGSGLGLFTVHKMVRLLEGALTGNNQIGGGMRWTVELKDLSPDVGEAEHAGSLG
jgi:signal transduction histidine kinase